MRIEITPPLGHYTCTCWFASYSESSVDGSFAGGLPSARRVVVLVSGRHGHLPSRACLLRQLLLDFNTRLNRGKYPRPLADLRYHARQAYRRYNGSKISGVPTRRHSQETAAPQS